MLFRSLNIFETFASNGLYAKMLLEIYFGLNIEKFYEPSNEYDEIVICGYNLFYWVHILISNQRIRFTYDIFKGPTGDSIVNNYELVSKNDIKYFILSVRDSIDA